MEDRLVLSWSPCCHRPWTLPVGGAASQRRSPLLSGRDLASSCSCFCFSLDCWNFLHYILTLNRLQVKITRWSSISRLRAMSVFLGSIHVCLIGTRHPWTWVGCLGACRVVVVFPGKGGKEFSRFGTPHKMKGVLYLWGHFSPSTRDFERSAAHILPWPLLGLNFSQQVSSLQENLRFFSLPHFFCFVLCKQFLPK